MTSAYINDIVTAVPQHDVHRKFVEYCPRLLANEKLPALFFRLAKRTQIKYRYPMSSNADDFAFIAFSASV